MSETWLAEDKLFSIDEKVRVERGPQIIDLECCDENLSDEVTSPHYKVGGRDARGRVIGGKALKDAGQKVDMRLGTVEKGETMSVVDWREKRVPHVWKIYQRQEVQDTDPQGNPTFDKEGEPVLCERFIQVGEEADKDAALAKAREIHGGMQ